MFDQLICSSIKKVNTGYWRVFIITSLIWVGMASGAVGVSIWAYDAYLTNRQDVTMVFPQPPYALPKKLGTQDPRPQKVVATRGLFSVQKVSENMTPSRTDSRDPLPDIGTIGDEVGVPDGDQNGKIGGRMDGLIDGIATDPIAKRTTQPPIPDRVEEVVKPPIQNVIHISKLDPGSVVRRIEPGYPEIAKRIKVSGTVVVEIVIDEQGNVVSARALSGNILLNAAAVSAARNWKWKPTILNGAPVKVVGTISFNFNLS